MKDWSVPMCGLKPAATTHKIMMQSFATRHSLSSGGGLQPALPEVIFGTEGEETAEHFSFLNDFSLRPLRLLR
jgi:hypothetical protein